MATRAPSSRKPPAGRVKQKPANSKDKPCWSLLLSSLSRLTSAPHNAASQELNPMPAAEVGITAADQENQAPTDQATGRPKRAGRSQHRQILEQTSDFIGQDLNKLNRKRAGIPLEEMHKDNELSNIKENPMAPPVVKRRKRGNMDGTDNGQHREGTPLQRAPPPLKEAPADGMYSTVSDLRIGSKGPQEKSSQPSHTQHATSGTSRGQGAPCPASSTSDAGVNGPRSQSFATPSLVQQGSNGREMQPASATSRPCTRSLQSFATPNFTQSPSLGGKSVQQPASAAGTNGHQSFRAPNFTQGNSGGDSIQRPPSAMSRAGTGSLQSFTTPKFIQNNSSRNTIQRPASVMSGAGTNTAQLFATTNFSEAQGFESNPIQHRPLSMSRAGTSRLQSSATLDFVQGSSNGNTIQRSASAMSRAGMSSLTTSNIVQYTSNSSIQRPASVMSRAGMNGAQSFAMPNLSQAPGLGKNSIQGLSSATSRAGTSGLRSFAMPDPVQYGSGGSSIQRPPSATLRAGEVDLQVGASNIIQGNVTGEWMLSMIPMEPIKKNITQAGSSIPATILIFLLLKADIDKALPSEDEHAALAVLRRSATPDDSGMDIERDVLEEHHHKNCPNRPPRVDRLATAAIHQKRLGCEYGHDNSIDTPMDEEDEPEEGSSEEEDPRPQRRAPRNSKPKRDPDRTQLSYYEGPFKTALELGKKQFRGFVALHNSFPTREHHLKDAAHTLTRALDHCVTKEKFVFQKHEVQTRETNVLVFKEASTFRCVLKTMARPIVYQHYKDFVTAPLCDGNQLETQGMVQDAVKSIMGEESEYLMGGLDDQKRTNNLAHPAIREICVQFYYGRGEESVAALYEKDFKDTIPENAVALVCTCIHNCLDEYGDLGHYFAIKLDGKRYQAVYHAILDLIDSVKQHPYHKAKWDKNRCLWAREGMRLLNPVRTQNRRIVMRARLD
ncbi:hypothetical protein NLJ89_g9027 [Agrocybe chaxingu]|uniref:DUF6532 domain-containing protein n=1 Tax=Agrocybe chaxingu TaxID=84603 RepID=A0A9W8JUA9_9AGAR|nr:hypothetical protein NLJ89_g9027 [Agrocybe chaxingu]